MPIEMPITVQRATEHNKENFILLRRCCGRKSKFVTC